jgi:hypothetical protein
MRLLNRRGDGAQIAEDIQNPNVQLYSHAHKVIDVEI